MPTKIMTRLLAGTAVSALLTGAAFAADANARPYDIPQQDAATALQAYAMQSGRQVLFPYEAVKGKQAPQIKGDYSDGEVIALLAQSAGLKVTADDGKTVTLRPQSAAAEGEGGSDAGTVQALIVTAQKREENIQDVPIAMSAFTQEDLTRSQVAGGADLMTQVPNMTFTKTNFSSYSIQIRGIGTQAISATTDAAVAVAFNNTPFIRNRFFEQEFYDLQRVEVLRGPQGTLYGRNATAGVVNIISQKPKFTYEAKLSADVANFKSHRFEGMLNIPLVDDKVALRVAGAWTKRDGYDTNAITGNQIDGRDLWSTRVSLRFTPTAWLDANLIWEHFQENDDRLRSGKQLCHQDNRDTLGPLTIVAPGKAAGGGGLYSNVYSQGCLPASLYSPDSLQAPNGYALPYFLPTQSLGALINLNFNPYASLVQSPDLRVIESTVDPKYRAKSDLVELQWSADLAEHLTLTSETSYNYDNIYSQQDFNRFNTESGAFVEHSVFQRRENVTQPGPNGFVFCDPQIGCADRLVAIDLSRARSSQFSQEFRLSSDYDGPFNFSLGANFLRYDTLEKYYVFINTLSMAGASNWLFFPPFDDPAPLQPWVPGVTDGLDCMGYGAAPPDVTTFGYLGGCQYVDPNPIESVNDLGHNYFLSKNPYKLISYAVFGESYYNITDDLKITAGLRWTVDKKQSPRIPSELLAANTVGYPVLAVENQEWREPTGRLAIDWKPDLSFTDETLLYASFAHGYKAGGSNPPPSRIVTWTPDAAVVKQDESVAKPKTFDPEFVNAFEIGSKNTLLDGKMTLNLAGFYYDYKGYQVSQIIDRSAVNYNFDAKVWGLELEADWRPIENLRLGFKGGYEHTRIADGEKAIDIMERNYGHGPDSADPWVVIRPFPSFPSNCVLPLYVFDQGLGTGETNIRYPEYSSGAEGPCEFAYTFNKDPVTMLPYVADPTLTVGTGGGIIPLATATGSQQYINYPGFNPEADYGNNHGEGFFKPLGGNELPNAPHFTATVTADYTIPLPNDWLATLHTDLYYQSEAWTRVFNMPGYDKLKAFTNVNVAAIFTNEDAGWKVMAYVKNVFDKDNITGAFLNSDDTGLTTNIFLVEPRLYGLRVTKDFNGGPWWTGANPDHVGPYPLTVELMGSVIRQDAPYSPVLPPIAQQFDAALSPARLQNRGLDWGDGREIKLTYQPGGAWSVSGSYRYGRSNSNVPLEHASEVSGPAQCAVPSSSPYAGFLCSYFPNLVQHGTNWSDSTAREHETHAVADFAVGRDVGLGLLGDSHSTIKAGLRYASFKSTTWATMRGIPQWDVADGWAKYASPYQRIDASLQADRAFKGAGPTLSWDAAQRLWGDEKAGHLDLDWGLTGGVLFGKQKTEVSGHYASGDFTQFHGEGWTLATLPEKPIGIAPRKKEVSVPMLDLSLGLTYEVQRFKVGAGYRWERYFNVLDAGYAEHKDYDRTIDGPYFKIAVGFGG